MSTSCSLSLVVKRRKMIKYPIILVLSEGSEQPECIIEKIRKQPGTEDVDQLGVQSSSCDVRGFKFHLVTKYYQTNLYLVPFSDDVSLLPAELQEATEGVLIYFDAGKRSFADKIPKYAEFVKQNEIEFGILLCSRLYENSNEGITYKEAKQASRFLDVIELERTRDEGEEDDPHDPLGYDELMQAIRSFIWSNVKMGDQNSASANSNSQVEGGEVSQQAGNSVEAELEIFEKLLTEMMHFKNTTSSMSRNERLAYAEQFASKFEDIIGEGPNSSDEG